MYLLMQNNISNLVVQTDLGLDFHGAECSQQFVSGWFNVQPLHPSVCPPSERNLWKNSL